MAKAAKDKHEVIKPFRHESDFSKIYNPGDDVDDVSEDQLLRLADLGHVKLSNTKKEQSGN